MNSGFWFPVFSCRSDLVGSAGAALKIFSNMENADPWRVKFGAACKSRPSFLA
jgi:hypothetical protein